MGASNDDDAAAGYDPDDYYAATYENPADPQEDPGSGAVPPPSGRAGRSGGLTSPSSGRPPAPSPWSLPDLAPIVGRADDPGGPPRRQPGRAPKPGDEVRIVSYTHTCVV